MIEEEARHILHMIRKRNRFIKMKAYWGYTLGRIQDELKSLEDLQSPQGNTDGVRSQNPINIATRINSLLTDEMEALDSYTKVCGLLDDSDRYYSALVSSVYGSDLEFVRDFLSGKNQTMLSDSYGYADAHKRMITIIRNLNIPL